MPVELQHLRQGDTFAGRYRVLRLIRAGGMGAVYEVEDSATRRRRALKIMHPSLVQSPESRVRFQREVFIGAELQTEHVVEVLDAGLDASTQAPYLTMELLRGEELGDRLERLGRLSAEETCLILAQTARALDKAHQRGIVHRDLKPENVFLTYTDDESLRVKILDFGIAKLVEGAHTNATQAAGTPLYMAPEQTDNGASVSPMTDIWALGLVAYRMLVGASYWQAESLQQLYRQILVDPLTSPVHRAYARGVQLPPAFDHWFAGCVARSPTDRYPSAGQAVADLSRVFGVSISRPTGVTPTPGAAQGGYAPYAQAPGAYAGGPGVIATAPLGDMGGYAYPPTVPGGAGGAAGGVGTVLATQDPPPYGQQRVSTGAGGAVAGVVASPPKRAKWGAGGRVAAVVGGLVLCAGVAGAAYFATRDGNENGKGNGSASGLDAASDPLAPPSSASGVRIGPDGRGWVAAVDRANPFIDVGAKPFALQKHEVTREEYARFLAGEKGKPSARRPLDGATALVAGARDGKLPITWVTYEMADAYCRAIGARLPTAAEWDAAVAGDDGRKYPWGKEWPKTGSASARDLAAGRGETASIVEVGTSPLDTGSYGHVDLAGNVQEWTSTDTKQGKLLRGTDAAGDEGEFNAPGEAFTEASAPPDAVKEAKAGDHLGFRCARERR